MTSNCKNKKKNKKIYVYSGHALSFISQRDSLFIGMPLKQRKQIFLNKHNKVKNPNWQEADHAVGYIQRVVVKQVLKS